GKCRQPRLSEQFVYRRNLPQQFRLLRRNRSLAPRVHRHISTQCRAGGNAVSSSVAVPRVNCRPFLRLTGLFHALSMEVRGSPRSCPPLTKSWLHSKKTFDSSRSNTIIILAPDGSGNPRKSSRAW